VSLSPLSPSVAHDAINLCLSADEVSDADFHRRQHSTPNRMMRIHESPSREDVHYSARLPEAVHAADIPPDSRIRSMFVISYSLMSVIRIPVFSERLVSHRHFTPMPDDSVLSHCQPTQMGLASKNFQTITSRDCCQSRLNTI